MSENNEWTTVTFNNKSMGLEKNETEREGEKDTDERRESSGKAPRLGAPAKDLELLGLRTWALGFLVWFGFIILFFHYLADSRTAGW